MKCKEAKKLMGEYLDQMLEGTRKQAFEEHLAACSSCRDDMVSTQNVLAWLQTAPEATPPPGLRQKVLRKLQQEKHFSGTAGRTWLPPAVAAAVIFVLLVAGNLLPGLPARETGVRLNAYGSINDADDSAAVPEASAPEADAAPEITAARDDDGNLPPADMKREISARQEVRPPLHLYRVLLNVAGIPLLALSAFLAVKRRKESKS
ncbi:MAG TPA: hypothetical protein GX699_03765 [Firmicutes bacterium]|nr:hypothetical protein [Bacillota bacterium]